MTKTDRPHIKYLDMGPWPVYVGLTCDERKFRREMLRLFPNDGQDIRFIDNDHSAATTHIIRRPGEQLTMVIAIGPRGERDWQAYAALVAHEVTHVVQEMRMEFITVSSPSREGLGAEAEAYIMQYVLQSCLYQAEQRVKEKD